MLLPSVKLMVNKTFVNFPTLRSTNRKNRKIQQQTLLSREMKKEKIVGYCADAD